MEECFIGALLVDPWALADVRDLVTEGDFTSSRCRLVYATAIRLQDDLGGYDWKLLTDALWKEGLVPDVIGSEWLFTLAVHCPTSLNAVPYAKRIAEGAAERRSPPGVVEERVTLDARLGLDDDAPDESQGW
jgi:replicative DNA helicase